MKLNSFVTVADATKVKVYMKNFGEFYNNQIEAAGTIILSRTQKMSQEKLEAAVAMLREKNADAAILTTPWDQLDGKTILAAIEKVSLADELLGKMRAEHAADEAEHEHAHHHHDHEHAHEEHEHHHDHDHHDHEEHDHHHDHDEHAHHHDHDHECDDPNCSCHHHHHHADEVFTSWGKETPKVFAQADIERILTALDSGDYGKILRAKGIVNGEGGKWIEFDFVPEEHEVRAGHPDYTGRLCVIGAELQASDPVLSGALGRDKDDRHPQRAQVAQQLVPIQAGQHNIQKRHIKIGGFDEIRRCPAILGQRAAVSGAGQRHLDQPRDQVLILHDQYVVHPRFLPVWGYCNPVLLQGCVLTAIILHFFILFSTRAVV